MWLMIVSCKEKLIGEWKLDSYSYHSNLPIEYLLIDEDEAIVIDDKAIKYYFTYQQKSRGLILENQSQEITFSKRIVNVDSMKLDSLSFIPVENGEQDLIMGVDLLGIESNKVIKDEIKKRQYVISAMVDSENGLIIKLGGRISKLNEIPIFLSCGHCPSNKEAMLILDKEISYQNFKDICYWLKLSEVWKIAIVTKSNSIGEYEGIYQKIGIWKEDMDKFRKLIKGPPPLPLFSRKDYLASLENVLVLDIVEEKDPEKILNFIDEGGREILINLDQVLSLEKYVKLSLNIINLLDGIKEEKALEEYQMGYQELTMEQKRVLSRKLPRIKFEMRI